MTARLHRRPVILCVLDGWGHRETQTDNAIIAANTPNIHRLRASSPHALLDASGVAVGLPEGLMGNSEVGHLNLGAGRVVNQDIRRIDTAIADGSLASNRALGEFIRQLKSSGGTCHLLGLVSPGGVHSHQKHIATLAGILNQAGIAVAMHAFLDGRDTPPSSAGEFVRTLEVDLAQLDKVSIATVCGRFYAMDRDSRWDRVQQAYDLMVSASGHKMEDAASAIRNSYANGQTDEFVEPATIAGYGGMRDGDGLLMANFRADRAREILQSLLDPEFSGFTRERTVAFASALGMTEYSTKHNSWMRTLFSPQSLNNILGEVIAAAGLRQLRIAETEKYAHVTFFFNGGVETPLPNEDRVLIPSPRVATYDEKPEMSAPELTDRIVTEIDNGIYDFILVNYANPDMVGHTGVLEAAETAVRTVDASVGRLAAAIQDTGGVLFITADHGNAETMRDEQTGEPHTAHTVNLVPAILVNAGPAVRGLANGRLADVAPTMLTLLDLPVPAEMSGTSLLLTSADTEEFQEHVPA